MTAEQPNAAASTDDFEFAALREAHNYRRALVGQFASHLRGGVIEIGAGIGQITGILRGLPTIERLVSVEPDARFCRLFRAAFPGRTLIEGTIQQVPPSGPWHAPCGLPRGR